MEGLVDAVHEENIVEYLPGDILWTKIRGLSYWPCMVVHEPERDLAGGRNIFTRIVKYKDQNVRVYHVQYIGSFTTRCVGWTSRNTFRFREGKLDIDKRKAYYTAQYCLRPTRVLRMKVKEFTIKNDSGLLLWYGAIYEALQMCLYHHEERILRFAFRHIYEHLCTIRRNSLETDDESDPEIIKLDDEQEDSSKVCSICKEGYIEFACTGNCKRYFHLRCLGLHRLPSASFKCSYCLVGRGLPKNYGIPLGARPRREPAERSGNAPVKRMVTQSTQTEPAETPNVVRSADANINRRALKCFACGVTGNEVKKCPHKDCQKSYHPECLRNLEGYNDEMKYCSQHICLTCHRENPRSGMIDKNTILKCHACPVAFHDRELCVPAGSYATTVDGLVMCAHHFIGKRNNPSPLPTINLNYCTACNEGGELICCDGCPSVFHARCLNSPINVAEDSDFLCENCKKNFLLFQTVVWAKTGKYRWWPAKIISRFEIPENIMSIKHHFGEFCVKFYGTNEYAWTHRGRVYLYVETHKSSVASSGSSRLEKQYKLALEEAAKGYDSNIHFRENYGVSTEKPDVYKKIRVNRALKPAKIRASDAATLHRCNCDSSGDDPCGPMSNCLNRSMMIECHAKNCPVGFDCVNRRFQKRQYAKTTVVKTRGRGWGLKTSEEIKRGDFVIEYVGEVITLEEYRRRLTKSQEEGIKNYYFMYLDGQRMIDAGPMGNKSRFINHSCDPNCEMVKWSVNGDLRIGIFALKDIPLGTELTFNYKSDDYQQKCLCGSSSCKGFIGKATSSASAVVANNAGPSSSRGAAVKTGRNAAGRKARSVAARTGRDAIGTEASNAGISGNNSNALFPKVILPKIQVKDTISMPAKRGRKRKMSNGPEGRHESVCFECKKSGTLILCCQEECGRAFHFACTKLADIPEGGFICPAHL